MSVWKPIDTFPKDRIVLAKGEYRTHAGPGLSTVDYPDDKRPQTTHIAMWSKYYDCIMTDASMTAEKMAGGYTWLKWTDLPEDE